MAHFLAEPFTFLGLRDKVVVLTGGSNGIGAAAVRLLHENGAHVFFGDVDDPAGKALAASFPDDRVHFVHTDVASYSDILELFKQAYSQQGHIDHAFAVAGISEQQSTWFHPALSLEAVETCPDLGSINVNLVGVAYFSHIAAAYMRQGQTPSDTKKSLVLVSSIAGFTESPGLPLYGASKHGILSLMRSLRTSLYTTHGISVSAVCPWMVLTGMVTPIAARWQRAGLAMNSADDVANVILGLAATADESNGKAIYVEGGRGWDIEEGLDRTRVEWMGREQSLAWEKGQELLSSHSDSAAYWATKVSGNHSEAL